MTEHTLFTDKEHRLFQMGGSFIAIQTGMVNIQDLMSAKPGSIVRCHANPDDCLKVVQVDAGPVGCVAGWISEDESA